MRRFDLPGRSPVIAENGLAATSHPLATATAVAVLREGGNAVDAAVAASAVLCVVEPHMTGIGGDCFAIIAEPDGSVHGLNGSGRAPEAANAAGLREAGFDEMPQNGPHSVTVPGAVKAWETLLERFGSRGFDELFGDAIRYAEDGFAVHARVARDWQRQVAALAADEGAAMHCLIGGQAPAAGSRFRFPALAGTLRAMAKGGAKAFYEGPIAAEIADTVQAGGGVLSQADLAMVTADWVEPILTRFRDHDILEIPPNGQGITALILLNLLEACGAGACPPQSADRHHLQIEAARLAYSVRDHMVSDSATMRVSPADLLSDAYTERLAAWIDRDRRNAGLRVPPAPRSDTVYLTVVDRDRRAVSFINSVYDSFGSKIVTPQGGVALQNRGACFSLEPDHPNEYGPGKRPLHTIIPAMAMRNGRAEISFGVMGGAYQPMGQAHVLSNMLCHGMDPQAALDDPRLFWGEDGVLEAETGIAEEVRGELGARGHTLRAAENPHGGGQVIRIDHDSGFLIGGSDPRKDGCALGW
ncbi:gamma-glutamyltransferase family protein [Mesorhizobium xinjiangense]|uniref:gamma-glutamyltransferase family protein n=1 Tax=Mesorhizobium xinjiangense TaxID=2678685 RepID=UPI0012EEBFE8|nr:gamma-glutamyltransferase family protein [Mesorhizobium xinjiangense]